jgi:LDH2 family malate/lactate/ureidoglycolate dehydrogenase
MKNVSIENLSAYIHRIMCALELPGEDAVSMARIYIYTTKRGTGHHDINNLPLRIDSLKTGKINAKPRFERLAAFGGMERWDGDNGLGEIINTFIMRRAIELAGEHGIGFCTVRNSNHYLCSAPYTADAADHGCIGFIIAKGVPTMGTPGVEGKIIGQSPIGYAFPAGLDFPVLMDICLAYASGEQLMQKAREGIPIPDWWGVDKDGKPTTDALELLKGTKYPIGAHKGFGLALLCELLTGVISGGMILDENEKMEGIAGKSTSHTAIAIKVDALMGREEYNARSGELIRRLNARAENIHIPGQGSYTSRRNLEDAGKVGLKDEIYHKLCAYAEEFQIEGL